MAVSYTLSSHDELDYMRWLGEWLDRPGGPPPQDRRVPTGPVAPRRRAARRTRTLRPGWLARVLSR